MQHNTDHCLLDESLRRFYEILYTKYKIINFNIMSIWNVLLIGCKISDYEYPLTIDLRNIDSIEYVCDL